MVQSMQRKFFMNCNEIIQLSNVPMVTYELSKLHCLEAVLQKLANKEEKKVLGI